MTKVLAKITKFAKKTMKISVFIVSVQASISRGGRSQKKKKLILLSSQRGRRCLWYAESHRLGSHHQNPADFGTHDHSVEQWATNSSIAVIGHHSQQEKLCTCTDGEEEDELGSTVALEMTVLLEDIVARI
jgi:hypothetical protein